MDPGRRSRLTIALIILQIGAITVLLFLVSVPLVNVQRPGVAWFGITLEYYSGPSDSVFNAHVGEFCPPQGDNSALVVGNVTLSLTWTSANGRPVSNFNIYAADYPVANDSNFGTYVYVVNNSSGGGFSSESSKIFISLCNYPLTIGAGVPMGDSVKVTIETVYTYNTTAPVL
jgi:hypothetical protein